MGGREFSRWTPNVWLLMLAVTIATSAQAPASATPMDETAYVPTMTCDVASVREMKPNPVGSIMVTGRFDPPDGSTLRLLNHDLRNLLAWAYGAKANHTEGIPKEFNWAMFTVEAKSDTAADERLKTLSKEQVQLEQQHMIQVLLAERFKLKVHLETREGPTYELVVSKAGRLKSTGVSPSEDELKRWGDRPIPSLYQQGDSRRGFEYIAHGATTADIARMLAGQFGHDVADKTGLTGKYDFRLKTYEVRSGERKEDETNPWPPLDTAIEDQLGLKLVPSRGPVQFLVVDHVEKPSEN